MSLSPVERLLLQRRLLRLQRRRSASGGWASGFLLTLAILPAAALMAAVLGGAVLYASLAGELEQGLAAIDNIAERDFFQTTRIYDRNGLVLREIAPLGKRTYIGLAQMPEILLQATIAVEDKDFYQNAGVDIAGIARAVEGVVTGDRGGGGGSTLTQQLVRNIAFSDEERFARSYRRKIKEIVLALILTRRHTKDQILEWYLNEVYYGNLAYGVEAAAQTLFDKSAAELDLAEAALIAGLPQAPGSYDPLSQDPLIQERVKERQTVVLSRLLEEGYIDQAAHDAALERRLAFKQAEPEEGFNAPHFVVYVQSLLEDPDGPYINPKLLAKGGLEITTTLDYGLQLIAEREVREHVEALRARHDLSSAALVALEPGSGQVLAMVGSADYWDDSIDGEVNVAVRERQPGSSIKPVTYLTAIEQGVSPAQLFWDVPMEVPAAGLPGGLYVPRNYDGKFHGPVRMRRSLANSFNIPALKALGMAGVENTIATAHRLGINGLQAGAERYGLSLTLGGGEATLLDMTTVYASLANLGRRVRPNTILKISDASGKVLYDLEADEAALEAEKAADPRAAYIVTDMLSDNAARAPSFGAGNPLSLPFKAAAKTGTTNDYRDNWTLGYTPYLAVGVWAGNPDNRPMKGSSGVTGAAPIWNAFMRQVAGDKEKRAVIERARARFGLPMETQFKRPEGIVEGQVCRVEDLKSPATGCPAYDTELFLKDQVAEADVDWMVQPVVLYGREGPDPDAEVPAGAERPLKTLLGSCLAGPEVPADRVNTLAVLRLPVEGESNYQLGERRFIQEWAAAQGWPSLEAELGCTPEMAAAALGPEQVAAIATPGSLDGAALALGTPLASAAATYRLNLSPGAVLSARTELTGTVLYDPGIVEYFKVEYGPGQEPREWFTVGSTHKGPVQGGTLEVLDATALPPGPYVVRLVLVKRDGNFLGTHAVPVEIGRP